LHQIQTTGESRHATHSCEYMFVSYGKSLKPLGKHFLPNKHSLLSVNIHQQGIVVKALIISDDMMKIERYHSNSSFLTRMNLIKITLVMSTNGHYGIAPKN